MILITWSILISFIGQIQHVYAECKWSIHTKEPDTTKLSPLFGKIYKACDDEYCYNIGICTAIPSHPTVGILQTKKDGANPKVVGRINSSSLLIGDNWLMLQYREGDHYSHHCNKEARSGKIMITCKVGEIKGSPTVLEEDRDKNGSCSYLFDLESDSVCSERRKAEAKKLSIGSVFLIIFFTAVGCYLLFGVLYMRCVRNAQGVAQIPNHKLWVNFGALISDGCFFVCRCAERQEEHAYSDLDTDRLSTPSMPPHSPGRPTAADDDALITM